VPRSRGWRQPPALSHPGAGGFPMEGGRRVDLLLIPLILVGVFVFPFAMAWLEPKKTQTQTPTQQERRTALSAADQRPGRHFGR
jgi:hypothetical protein